MERRPRRALLGGAESSSGQRARGGGEGDEILHGRLLELAVEEEACAARRWSRAGSAASSLPRLRPMAARAREGAGEEGSGVCTSLLSSLLAMEVPADLGWCQVAARRRFGGPFLNVKFVS